MSELNEATESRTLEIVERFNEAFNRHDVDAVMRLMTEDCVFENTRPAPDGERLESRRSAGTDGAPGDRAGCAASSVTWAHATRSR